MHHAADVHVVHGLFAGYGSRPPWRRRHAAMLERCEELRERCAQQGQQGAAIMWAERAEVTAGWEALPSDR